MLGAPQETAMTTMKRSLAGWLAALATFAAALPQAASAQEARASNWVNLRAGPEAGYPLVARLAPGTPLVVQGCTAGYGWCDVVGPDGLRGWVYAANLVYPYESRSVPVIGYGALIGLPIVTFVIGSYWNDYYRNRPWYGNRARWEHRPPPRPPAFLPGPPRPPGWRPPVGGGHHPPSQGFRPPGADHRPPDVRPPRGPGPAPRLERPTRAPSAVPATMARPPRGERPNVGGGRPTERGQGRGQGRQARGGDAPRGR
jgi:uncharacterized protein YraI